MHLTKEQFKKLESIKPLYDRFKRLEDAGIQFLSKEELSNIKSIAKDFNLPVDDTCMSCGPDLLIRLIRHYYLPNVSNHNSR